MKFSKMHGLGNDFLIFEDDGTKRDWSTLAIEVCARRVGVGADGIMVVMPSEVADVKMRIINTDGSEAAMCGNGIRCFAKYVYENDIVTKTDMEVETLAGIIRPKLILQDGQVSLITVDMGKPSFDKKDIPMKGNGSGLDVEIDVDGKKFVVSSLLMGVPHAVVLAKNIEELDTAALGPRIEKHDIYPSNINVNFVEILDNKNIRVKTYERGSGFTLACGTGSCACVVALNKKGLVDRKVTVSLAVGNLVIELLGDDRVLMSGPATLVYTAFLQ